MYKNLWHDSPQGGFREACRRGRTLLPGLYSSAFRVRSCWQFELLAKRFTIEVWAGSLILICFELLERNRRIANATARNLRVGTPGDGIEHQFSKIRFAPVPMIVATGESKAAAAIGPVGSPSNVLRLPML